MHSVVIVSDDEEFESEKPAKAVNKPLLLGW